MVVAAVVVESCLAQARAGSDQDFVSPSLAHSFVESEELVRSQSKNAVGRSFQIIEQSDGIQFAQLLNFGGVHHPWKVEGFDLAVYHGTGNTETSAAD